MQQQRIRPSHVTFGILQQACWGHADAATEIRQLLRLMEVMEVTPERLNYNALIRAYSESGQLTMALQVANRMREAGISWDQFTYQYILAALVVEEQLQTAVRLLTGMRGDGVRPRAKHYMAVFVGLAQAGYYEDAVRVFQRLASIGPTFAGLFAYNVMMGIQCRRGDMAAALQMFEKIKEVGMEPNTMSFRILMEGYVVAGDWMSALDMQTPVMEYRDRLRKMCGDTSATESARAAAAAELQKSRHWMKVYYLLIDAALWNDEWIRAVDLVRDLVEQGLPAHPVRHARLVKDLAFYSSGSDHLVGVNADVIFLQLPGSPDDDPAQQRRAEWMARVPNMPKPEPSLSRDVGIIAQPSTEKLPLHAFAASFAPQWIDAHSNLTLDSIPDLCYKMLGRDRTAVQIDPTDAWAVIYAYYHTTLHRRSVVAKDVPAREQILGRAGPETIQSLQDLFDSQGWPGRAPHGYLFMRSLASGVLVVL